MTLPINVNVEHDERMTDTSADAFLDRWKIDGRAEWKETHVAVTVKDYEASQNIVRATLGHELGHAAFMSTMEYDEFQTRHADTFQWELMAWTKYATENRNARPMSLHVGKFCLDALNTYRRGHNVSDDEWERARQLVISWSRSPEDLAEYEPLEPPENAEPPTGCGDGWGFATGAPSAPNDDADTTADDDDIDGTVIPGNDEPVKTTDHAERDKWLHSGDGMATAAKGIGALEAKMLFYGWDMDDLPAITQALL